MFVLAVGQYQTLICKDNRVFQWEMRNLYGEILSTLSFLSNDKNRPKTFQNHLSCPVLIKLYFCVAASYRNFGVLNLNTVDDSTKRGA